ncbi:hypothetical protein E4T52_15241 [Aureobasidium sp. EXF-3400]|nr:hypothetical protein E4T51_14331 [Aureobasidium sp. EXF-12344]KAI4769727.1 hypothetical protein E4T52_15241 [Aureobasidium sp. EXF-3400]
MDDDNAILITAGPYQFLAKFEEEAPNTVATFQKLLPYRQKIIHVRWSGEAVWIPLGDEDFKLAFENHTAHPAAGQILFYPGGYSETELLFCYGNVAFASKMGALAANHFLTITEGQENLKALGKLVLWEGAQDVLFEVANRVKYARI